MNFFYIEASLALSEFALTCLVLCCWHKMLKFRHMLSILFQLVLQDKDATIAKLQADLHNLSLKCEAAHAQAEVSQPYEQRYRDIQVGSATLYAGALHRHTLWLVSMQHMLKAVYRKVHVLHAVTLPSTCCCFADSFMWPGPSIRPELATHLSQCSVCNVVFRYV